MFCVTTNPLTSDLAHSSPSGALRDLCSFSFTAVEHTSELYEAAECCSLFLLTSERIDTFVTS